MGTEIRRIRADEWPELRRLRLEALHDAPLAFGSTYERDAAMADVDWQRWAGEAAAWRDQVIFIAATDGRWVAMARGSVSRDESGAAYPTAVYVDPAFRGRGLGRAVSARVIAWARERGVRRLLLHVADWDVAARRTYESLGFVTTGATEPLPHDPSITEHAMVLDLR
ncbi:MAG: GNAT family N-acetyltransferase [Chloroflexi bacterium]|nr:GNAT family N-acetyltransferase [Chloroflexota bacterium]